jgi:NAD(P)-dependent dehydrogenase (short-subunit alcohol dehydrogenase family)
MSQGVFLVTGGTRGIGAATARLAAERGYKVAVFYRSDHDAADRLATQIGALAVQADVADEGALMRGFEAVDRLGRLEVLVNNAAVTGKIGRFADLTAADIEQVMRVNVQGPFIACREAVKRMSRKHGGQGGAIVNVSSGAARGGSPGTWIHYAGSKGALDTLTIGLAKEVAGEGIRVNGVRPGLVDTEIHAIRPPGQLEKMVKMVPMGRMGTPEEAARTILWLASAEASYVTGAIVDATGGF